MPQYPNPAGGTMEAANDADARAKGWTPAMGSFGINTYPGSSGGGGGSSAPAAAGGTDLGALRNFFGQTSGFSIKELNERARQFDAELEFNKQKWREGGLPEVEIERRAQALKEWQAEQDVALQEQKLGLDRGRLGLDYLSAAAQMGGPASVFQQADFLRGARQRGDVPGFLGSLANNTQLPAFTGAGNATMIPQTAAGLSLQLGSGQSVTLPGSTTGGAPAPGTPGFGTFVPAATAGGAPAQTYGQYDLGKVAAALSAQGNFDAGKFWQMMGNTANPSSLNYALQQSTGGRVQDVSTLGNGVLFTPTPAAPATSAAPTAAPAQPMGAPAAPGLGTDAAGYNYDAALNQIGNIFRAGPTGLAPGSLERLDPNEVAILRSGATKLGYDPDAWLRAYSRAGVGQKAGSAF